MLGWFKKRRASPFVGTWKLVLAGNEPPQSLHIRAMRLEIRIDGTYSWESVMQDQWDGMKLQGNGTWELDGERIRYTTGEGPNASLARINGSRLLLEPDFVLKRDGIIPVVGIYERNGDRTAKQS